MLKINIATATGNITVHSPSLQKLTVNLDVRIECQNIDIVAPVLKQLHLNVCAGRDTGVSVWAEVLEEFFWRSCYAVPLALGSWRLQEMRVHTIEKSDVDNREHELRLNLNDGVCLLSVQFKLQTTSDRFTHQTLVGSLHACMISFPNLFVESFGSTDGLC